LTLNGANTFTGGITLESGTLNLGNATALGAATGDFYVMGGTIDNTTGGQLTVSGKRMVWAGDLAFAGTQALTFSGGSLSLENLRGDSTRTINIPGAALTIAEGIDGPMGLTKAGTGDLNLSGAPSTFSGGLMVLGGNVTALDANASFGSGTVVLGDGVSANNVTLAAGLRSAGYDNAIVAASGGTGVLTIRSLANSTLKLNGSVLLNGNLTLATTGASNMTLNGALGGTGALTVSAGTAQGNVVQLNGDSSNYLGNITVSGGTVRLGNGNALGGTAGTTTVAAGAALDLNGNNVPESFFLNGSGINGHGVLINTAAGTTANVYGTAQLQTTSTVGGTGAISLNGAISGTGTGLTKEGTGTVTLTAVNAYTGPTTVRSGTLLADTTGFNILASQAIISTSSQLVLDGGTFAIQFPSNAARTTTDKFSSTSITGGSGNVIVQSPGTQTQALTLATISRTGGSVDFSNVGGVFGFGGTNKINSNTVIDSTGILGVWATVQNGANLATINTGVISAYSAYNNNANFGTVIPDSGTLADTDKNLRINSAPGANLTLGAATTNVHTLTYATATGVTIDTTGNVLRFDTGQGILMTPVGTSLTVGTAANAGTLTAGGLAINELVLSNFNPGASLTINSTIANDSSGIVGVSKVSPGIVTLAGTNTYTGATKVEDGTLFVVGSATGSITTVHTDATLGGTGTLGTVNVTLGANIAPGVNGIGTLHTGALSLNDGSTFSLELGGTAAGQYDRLESTSVTLGQLNAGPSLLASFVNGYVPQPGDTFTIMLNDGGGAVNGTFDIGSTLSMNNGAVVFNVNYAGGDGNDVTLTVAVPEPGTAALLAACAAPLLGLRRLRRRRA
jgi:autotransporter-associated beta strand protein